MKEVKKKKEFKVEIEVEEAKASSSSIYIAKRNLRTSNGDYAVGDSIPESNIDLPWLLEKGYAILCNG